MARKPNTELEHYKELSFIRTAWRDERACFSYDKESHNRYVTMQANFAEADGFADIARSMRQCLLIID